MATLFVLHRGADYPAWRRLYDGFDAQRCSMAVTSDAVDQVDGNSNDVTVYHEFDSMDTAKAFAGSTELREAMSRAGVVGAPDIWFTQRS